jgi:hypothetical protein
VTETSRNALRQLALIGAAARQVACLACGTPRRVRCPGSPVTGHLERLKAAWAAQINGMPPNFEKFTRIFAAAHPVSPCEPEITPDGKTVLWRGAPSSGAWSGRGSYWTHNGSWATAFARGFELSRIEPDSQKQSPTQPAPYAVYRAEVAISDRNACWHELEGDRSIGRLNRYIRDHPEWPGCKWLLFEVPMEALELGKLIPLIQYVHCGKRPIKAEKVPS